jgi:hypothetical protein
MQLTQEDIEKDAAAAAAGARVFATLVDLPRGDALSILLELAAYVVALDDDPDSEARYAVDMFWTLYRDGGVPEYVNETRLPRT